jgi:hypothetical protein
MKGRRRRRHSLYGGRERERDNAREREVESDGRDSHVYGEE